MDFAQSELTHNVMHAFKKRSISSELCFFLKLKCETLLFMAITSFFIFLKI